MTTYALPTEPPAGTHLWREATGQEWVRVPDRHFAWRLVGLPFGDQRYGTHTWTGLLNGGPLTDTPPEEVPA